MLRRLLLQTDDEKETTTTDDPQLEEACLFLAVVSCLVCCCFSTCIVRRLRRLSGLSARYLSAELTQPLIEDTDHETFLRSDDTWTCPVCEMRNSRSACDICGLAQVQKTDLRLATKKALGWDVNAKDLPLRQRRAARRRRWVRKDGRWRLSNEAASETSFVDPVVVTFHSSKPKVRLEPALGALGSPPWRLDDPFGGLDSRFFIDEEEHHGGDDDEEKREIQRAAAKKKKKKTKRRRKSHQKRRRVLLMTAPLLTTTEEDEPLRPMTQRRRHRSEVTDEGEYESSNTSNSTEADDLESGLFRGPRAHNDLLLSDEEDDPTLEEEEDDDFDDDDEFDHLEAGSSSSSSSLTEEKESDLEDVAKLSFGDKVLYFEKEVDKIRTLPTEGHARLEVRRGALLEESVQQLLALEPQDCSRWMRVQFVDEPGIDVGGLEREWFGLVAEALFDAQVGAFRYEKAAGAYTIAATAMLPAALGGHPRADELYEFTGRFIGKAILEHVPLGVSLAPAILKQLLGRPLEHDDLDDLDETLATNIQWLLTNEGVGDLELDFSVAVDNDAAPRRLFVPLEDTSAKFVPEDDDDSAQFFDARDPLSPVPTYYAVQPGPVIFAQDDDDDRRLTMVPAGTVVRELVEDGRNTRVDDDSKTKYAARLWRYHVIDAHRRALWHLAKGLYAVVPPRLLTLFDEREFDLLVAGSPHIDIDDWAQHTEYAGDYRRRGPKHTVIVWFWKILENLDHANRSKLLQYCTGSNRLPCHGFKALQRNDGKYQKFSIHSLPRNELRFPRAHTYVSPLPQFF